MLKITTLVLLVSEILMDNFYTQFHQTDYKLEFEWAEMLRITKAEVKRFDVHTFKYNRTTAVANGSFQYNFDIKNDLQIQIQAYKFASNEYRLFPIHFEVNFCDGIKYDIVGMSDLLKCGNFSGCPIRKDKLYHVCNWKPDESKFPPYIPNGRYMAEMQGLYHSKEMFVLKGLFTISRPFVK